MVDRIITNLMLSIASFVLRRSRYFKLDGKYYPYSFVKNGFSNTPLNSEDSALRVYGRNHRAYVRSVTSKLTKLTPTANRDYKGATAS